MGPKNFEAILSKTLQILIEGEYNNILKPSKHYIELKKDFSNIDEIIKITNDLNFCQKFVDDAKEDILKTYKILFISLPNNKFFQENYKFLFSQHLTMYNQWIVSNKWLNGNHIEQVYAHVWKDALHELVPLIALLTQGEAKME